MFILNLIVIFNNHNYREKKDKEEYKEKRKASLEKLDSIFDTVFYQVIPFSSKIEEFARSSIGSPSVISPVLSYDSNANIHGVSTINFSEKLEIDIWEIINGLHDEQANIISVLDPTTQIEGVCLFYKGYLVQNQLEKPYLEAVLRVALLYGLLERDKSRAEKGVVEVIQIDKKDNLYTSINLSSTTLDDYDFFMSKVTNEIKNKKEDSFEESNAGEGDKEEKKAKDKPKEPKEQTDTYTKERFLEAKRKDAMIETKGKAKKIVVMIARGEMLIAVVLHIVFKNYGGEYDPLYIERLKQTLFLMYDKTLIEIMESNYNNLSLSTPYHSAQLINKAPPLHVRVPK